eukprot:11041248-Karenia_brevis.AAC.1
MGSPVRRSSHTKKEEHKSTPDSRVHFDPGPPIRPPPQGFLPDLMTRHLLVALLAMDDSLTVSQLLDKHGIPTAVQDEL